MESRAALTASACAPEVRPCPRGVGSKESCIRNRDRNRIRILCKPYIKGLVLVSVPVLAQPVIPPIPSLHYSVLHALTASQYVTALARPSLMGLYRLEDNALALAALAALLFGLSYQHYSLYLYVAVLMEERPIFSSRWPLILRSFELLVKAKAQKSRQEQARRRKDPPTRHAW